MGNSTTEKEYEDMIRPFSAQAKTVAISVTATSSTSAALPGKGNTVRLVNEGPYICFVSIGSGAQTATVPTGTAAATATPILAGTDISLSLPDSDTYNIAAICRTGQTATLLVAVGEGI